MVVVYFFQFLFLRTFVFVVICALIMPTKSKKRKKVTSAVPVCGVLLVCPSRLLTFKNTPNLYEITKSLEGGQWPRNFTKNTGRPAVCWFRLLFFFYFLSCILNFLNVCEFKLSRFRNLFILFFIVCCCMILVFLVLIYFFFGNYHILCEIISRNSQRENLFIFSSCHLGIFNHLYLTLVETKFVWTFECPTELKGMHTLLYSAGQGIEQFWVEMYPTRSNRFELIQHFISYTYRSYCSFRLLLCWIRSNSNGVD